jgi:methylmalonyl-CoA mutase
MDDNEKLLSAFPPVTVEQWEAKIKEDLKGADYDKKLIRKTLENITIRPYYTAEDLTRLQYLEQVPGRFPYVRGHKTTGNDWQIRQDFKVTTIESALEKALLASGRGVTSVGYDLTNKGDLYFHDFRKLVSGIDYANLSIHFIAADSAPQILDFLIKTLDELKIDHAGFRGSLEFDPLGHLVETGGYYYSEQDDMTEAGRLVSTVRNELPKLKVLAVNSHIFSDTGASVVQELGYGLAMFSDYLIQLTDEELSAADIVKHMQWNLGVGSDYFMEIAKVRAARFLFSALLSGFGSGDVKENPIFIHSITSIWNKTLYDPNVNLLRLTTEAMAAILGGCDSLVVRPFDSTYNEPADFSERLARNLQNILKEESYFDKVIDPAAGSYYIETLTNALVESAWELFLKVDAQGGFMKAFDSGFIGEEIQKTRARRAEMLASRREILLGTNQYPNVNETVNGCISEEIAFPEAATDAYRIANPIEPGRAAIPFERLRLATEKRSGNRPKVFMLTYGNLAMRLARSQFSGNFFACAGYEIIDNLGFQSAKEGVDAAIEANADIIVICSSDEEYATIAPAVYELAKNKAIVVVAGAPACMEELKQKGITEFIHIRSNILDTLQRFHSKLGIALK